MTTQTFTLTRAAELEALPVLRSFVQQACAQCGIDQAVCDDLKLAVDEASTNIITHGYAGMDPGTLILELQLSPQRAVIRLTDFGHPFEPSQTIAPNVNADLEDRPEGGFGLYFIYNVMDEVSYVTREDGNCLTLVKRLD